MSDYVLAFDFGEVRIGIAGGSLAMRIATPLATVTGQSNADKFLAIAKLITEWQPTMLIVGLPRHIDGVEHKLTQLARTFANRLHGRFGLPVVLVDERLTSVAAEAMLGDVPRKKSEHTSAGHKKKQKETVDQVAAMCILQAWFDDPAANTVG